MHQRFNEVPDFFLYALSCQGIAFGDPLRSDDTAAGIKRASVRYGRPFSSSSQHGDAHRVHFGKSLSRLQ